MTENTNAQAPATPEPAQNLQAARKEQAAARRAAKAGTPRNAAAKKTGTPRNAPAKPSTKIRWQLDGERDEKGAVAQHGTGQNGATYKITGSGKEWSATVTAKGWQARGPGREAGQPHARLHPVRQAPCQCDRPGRGGVIGALAIATVGLCGAAVAIGVGVHRAVRDWARLSAGWRQDLDDRIVHLQRLRDNLADCIGFGCLSLRSCALFNPGDILAEQGPGPVRLQ